MEKEPQQRHKPAPEALSTSKITRAKFLQYMGWSGASFAGVFLKDSLFNQYQSSEVPVNVSKGLKSFSFEVLSVNNRGEIINRQQRQAKYFSEEIGNGINLEMVEIPGGTFMMGTEDQEIERLVKAINLEIPFDSESPQHQVTIQPFYMGKYVVTQAQWEAVAALPKVKTYLDPKPSFFGGANMPVETVTWWQAEEFCQRLSQKTGKQYRLPSEAEWEYACRAGTTTPFHFGEIITPELVNYGSDYPFGHAPKGEYRIYIVEVGSLPPNGFGLFEMHGNVWEWCADHWHRNYQGAPNDGSIWLSDNINSRRVLRGGSWDDYSWVCRSARRGGKVPDDYPDYIGFRVALSSNNS